MWLVASRFVASKNGSCTSQLIVGSSVSREILEAIDNRSSERLEHLTQRELTRDELDM